jgi:hypothetical protein
MALKAAMWVHGTIVEAEFPVLTVSRKGWGTSFTGHELTTNWFHIPIITPVILDDIRPLLAKVFVFYRATNARITNLHVYDGAKKVKSLDALNLSGDHSISIDASNNWDVTPPLGIKFGLSISVGVEFLKPATATNPSAEILFTSAGADFQKP